MHKKKWIHRCQESNSQLKKETAMNSIYTPGSMASGMVGRGNMFNYIPDELIVHMCCYMDIGQLNTAYVWEVFVQNVQCPKRPTIICPVMHEVVRPNVIAILGAKPDT